MKHIYLTIIYLSFLSALSFHSYSQTINVMSFNIRYDNPNDGENKWDNRKKELVSLIQYYEPAIFGLQEGLHHQLKYISDNFSNYSMIGIGREDGKIKGEFTAIFYDTLKFELLKEKTFWLSENEDSVSIGWDAALERICTYGFFKSKESNKKIYIFNTHFDHIGKKSQLKSAELILRKIGEVNDINSPVILMGDLNCDTNSEPIQILKNELTDGLQASQVEFHGPTGTFNGFKKDALMIERIDYIFIKNLEVIKYRHIDDKMKNNNYISDHLPVLIEIKIP